MYKKSDEKYLERVLKQFKGTHERATVILRGDQNLVYSELEQVLMQVAQAGITDTAYEVHDDKSK